MADIAESGVTSVALRGAHLGSDSDINHTNLVQKIILGESDERIRATLKETMVQNMLNKDTVQAIVDSEGVEIFPADTRLTEEGIEAILKMCIRDRPHTGKMPGTPPRSPQCRCACSPP